MNLDLLVHEWPLLALLVERSPLRVESIELLLPDGSSVTMVFADGESLGSPPAGAAH